MIGTIVGWLPEEGDDDALWHVLHLDGDEEDLEEHEVLECLIPLPETEATEASPENEMKVDDNSASNVKSNLGANGTTGEELVKDDSNMIVVTSSDNDDDEQQPDFIDTFSMGNKMVMANKTSQLGLAGLQQELFRLVPPLLETVGAMNKGNPALKQTKKAWEVQFCIAL